jgi:leucyl aminopeptidase
VPLPHYAQVARAERVEREALDVALEHHRVDARAAAHRGLRPTDECVSIRAMNAPPVLFPLAADALEQKAHAHDALVVVAPSPLPRYLPTLRLPAAITAALEAALAADHGLAKGARAATVLPVADAPGGRVVLATMGTLDDDVDDVRLVAETVSAAVIRAVEAGARAPVVALATPTEERYARALDVAALAALGSQWAPLEAREAGRAGTSAEAIGVLGLDEARARYVAALEVGRYLCRDITGTEPERMAPARVAALCEQAFARTGVKVTVERDVSSYPLLAAVARASMVVERHRPCVVRLEYVPEGPVTRTVMLAAKGVTYDTGGADLKTDGAMAGMSRDKGGAGAVAGLVRTVAALGVPGVRVVGLLGLVRNSVGEESFVSDEVIRARSGVRVRIGNTDAEGRLVLADLLAALREEAAGLPDPLLFSVATLTGHVYRAFGPYIGALENAPARARNTIAALAALGEAWGEPMEWTRPRREDYAFCAARSSAEDVVSSNRLASVNTPRGHQGPYAFLDVASGLKAQPLPFVHLDIGGVAVTPPDWQFGRPTGTPIATLAAFLAGR